MKLNLRQLSAHDSVVRNAVEFGSYRTQARYWIGSAQAASGEYKAYCLKQGRFWGAQSRQAYTLMQEGKRRVMWEMDRREVA